MGLFKRRYIKVQRIRCMRGSCTRGRLTARWGFVQVDGFDGAWLIEANPVTAEPWRQQARQGGLQVTRCDRREAAGYTTMGDIPERSKPGSTIGLFDVELYIAEVTYKGNQLRAEKVLWARPEFMAVASHLGDLAMQARTLRAASTKIGDAPYKQSGELKQQGHDILLAIAHQAIQKFIDLEKQVLRAQKAAAQDAARAKAKTAEDVVSLHGHLTSNLLADGERILKEIKAGHWPA